jgi:hypothetical protein
VAHVFAGLSYKNNQTPAILILGVEGYRHSGGKPPFLTCQVDKPDWSQPT